MISLRMTPLAAVLLVLLAGCGSNFEWFPGNDTFSNSFSNTSTAVLPVTAPGTVMREISFPAGVQKASDIVFDRSSGSLWLLGGTAAAPQNRPNVLVQISAVTGQSVRTLSASGWPAAIVDSSTLTYDGSSFWISSNGLSGAANASQVYLILSSGTNASYPGSFHACPATTTGFCQGLAWDSATTSFWSAGSDTARLVNYQVANSAVTSGAVYTNLWSGSGVSDVTYDSATGEVFVIKDGVIRVKGNSGTGLGTISFVVPGTGRGDWDGTYFWVVDNTAKKIKALYVR